MSRVGKKPVAVPEKVKVKVERGAVFVEGPLGKLSCSLPDGILAEVKDSKINLSVAGGAVGKSALYGTIRARVNNMVNGVTSGFNKVLEINGVGFKGAADASKLTMQLGFSHPVVMDIPQGIKMTFDPKATILTISGIDKDLVGNLAAQIKRVKPPEPYKGTGIKYQGEHIIRKAGKTAAGASAGAGGGAAKK
ncbi:MAG: 50S ribosomal protein L6 [Elusimicrobia bacterium GWA2_56_46]|nr:MAG: 50S ribosomal protein L6 [Elusimicrobia bacterium GWA2_56_46]OGR55009.1 MAG: 50S ribosomal protein L6 [Elusimicrobia bacterium GWC2_56_31]HBB67143.1 50S ribosomal protein L6 [Elusimicrobiota bacterium]HBW23980.1 50S ribosomal protein L6 [Elusimicrobiota bacterium]